MPAEPSVRTDAAAAAPAPGDATDRLRGRLMQRAIGALLDQVRGSREVMPHLAALELGLGEHGVDGALAAVPAHLLQKIFGQLRVLPIPSDDPVLGDLIARLQRQLRRQAPAATHQLAPFDPEATVVITEGSHSDFMNVLQGAR
jgi:hypothetical protein